MPNSFLFPTGGLFNKSLRFAFTNITDEVFTSEWDKVGVTVKPHETIEISVSTPIMNVGHALAIKMTGELVDKIMMGEAKMDEVSYYKNNPGAVMNSYRSPKGSSLGVPAARKVWEDKILKELAIDEESPVIQSIREELKKEIASEGDLNRTKEAPVPTSINEFADLTKKVVEQPKPEAKVKRIRRTKEQMNETSHSNSGKTN